MAISTPDKTKSTKVDSTKQSKVQPYTCDRFEGVEQTIQGTQHSAEFYSDGDIKTIITYSITDNTLSTKMVTPGFDDITDTAKFNKVNVDGSRKYGNSKSNYFVSVINDTSIKLVIVKFTPDVVITQICSR